MNRYKLLIDTILVSLFLNKYSLDISRIHALIFLISYDIEELRKLLDFIPNQNGIYSYKIDKIIYEFYKRGYVKKKKSRILLIRDGVMRAMRVINKYPYVHTVEAFVKFLKKLSDDELLAVLYYLFPKYFENVPKLSRIEENRLELAIRLFLKKKVPVEIAAKISGYNTVDFIEALRVRNMI